MVVGDLVGEGAAQEEAVVGDTPNLAARLQALAEPGAVVIAEATRRLLGDLFALRDSGAHDSRASPAPVAAFAVLGERTGEPFEARHAAALAPIVGRDQELALLLERWRQAKDGEGQVVCSPARRGSASRGSPKRWSRHDPGADRAGAGSHARRQRARC